MKTITKIACRTVGTLGIGVALYDTTRVANHFSKVESQKQQSKYLENAYFNSRTSDNMSYTSSAIGKKTFELRTNNPLPSIWGRIKGGCEGAMYSLGNHLFTIACSSLALLSKGTLAKVGAIGVGLKACYEIARNGFGLGKQNPMK